MPVPPNISFETAVEIVAGDSFTLDVRDATPPFHTVYYKHTVAAEGTYLSLWATTTTGEASNYEPTVWIYTGTAGSPVTFLHVEPEKQFLVPLDAGVTYFFEVFNGGASEPLDADLVFSAVAAPSINAPAGSVAVNEDATLGYPLVIFDATGTVLNQLRPFPAGEFGAILPDGTLLISDIADGNMKMYDTHLDLMAEIEYPVGFSGGQGVVGSNGEDTFVIGMQSSGQIASISSTGVVTPQAWDVNNVTNVAFSNDGTILYFTGDGSSISGAIKTISYPGGVAGADLAAGVTNYFVMDLFVMRDDTIIAGYFKSTGTDDNFVRQYSPAGAILNQYEFGTDQQINHITPAVDDPDSFWVWFYVDDGFSRFMQVRVSDGAILNSFDKPTYATGVCDITGALQTTDTRFGTPFSCPFWITRSSWPEEEVPGELGTATELPIRWVLRTGVIT